MLHVAIHAPWSNGHFTWNSVLKMVVPPWLRKPPFNDVLIDHMSDVPLVSNMSGCFSTPIMAARISPVSHPFLLGFNLSFQFLVRSLKSRPRRDLSVPLSGSTIFRLLFDFQNQPILSYFTTSRYMIFPQSPTTYYFLSFSTDTCPMFPTYT